MNTDHDEPILAGVLRIAELNDGDIVFVGNVPGGDRAAKKWGNKLCDWVFKDTGKNILVIVSPTILQVEARSPENFKRLIGMLRTEDVEDDEPLDTEEDE